MHLGGFHGREKLLKWQRFLLACMKPLAYPQGEFCMALMMHNNGSLSECNRHEQTVTTKLSGRLHKGRISNLTSLAHTYTVMHNFTYWFPHTPTHTPNPARILAEFPIALPSLSYSITTLKWRKVSMTSKCNYNCAYKWPFQKNLWYNEHKLEGN